MSVVRLHPREHSEARPPESLQPLMRSMLASLGEK
jgi:hypothetical protein